jgi:hypothetical protein
MTEPRYSEHFAALAALRLSIIRCAADLAVASARLAGPLDIETLRGWRTARALLAEQLAEIAQTLALGVEVVDRTAAGALEDTAVDGDMGAVGRAEVSGVSELP